MGTLTPRGARSPNAFRAVLPASNPSDRQAAVDIAPLHAPAGVMPGTIQCPEDGAPYILSIDAGTVGGYPRVAQVARADRHILGQLKAGDHVRLLHREHDTAVEELRAKLEYWRPWLPEIDDVLC